MSVADDWDGLIGGGEPEVKFGGTVDEAREFGKSLTGACFDIDW